MVTEVLEHLKLHADSNVVDATVGLGGHAEAILSKTTGRLLGLDRDIQSLALARERLAPFGRRVVLMQANFASLASLIPADFDPVHGIVMDLGLSSWQLAERGFSFNREAALDFRMDARDETTAAELVNQLPEKDLADLLYRYGDEHRSRRIAKRIVEARDEEDILTTVRLADIIASAIGRRGKIHPATKSFQALRIAVNDELGSLERGLAAATTVLEPGGRLAVISFHSLEDRIVKRFTQDAAHLTRVNKRVIRPTDAETDANPRSRSAKLRVVEKKAD